MIKKINLLSLAALSMIGQSAMSQSSSIDSVTLYGRVAADVEAINYNGNTNKSVNSNNSYVGIKARENFSGGNHVFTDLQIGVGVDNGNTASNSADDPTFRKAVIGLGSDYGNIWLGRSETAYYQVAKQFDPFYGLSSASNLAILGQTPYTNPTAVNGSIGFNKWRSNTIGVESPEWSNLKLLGTYSNRENEISAPATSSLAVVYDNNALQGALAFERQNFSANTNGGAFGGGNDKALKAAVSYTFPTATKLFLNAERIENERDSLNYKRNAYSIGVAQAMGSHEVMGSYTQAGSGSHNVNVLNSDFEAKQLSVGYKYNFSKRTAAMATASYIKNGSSGNYNLAYNPVDLNNGSNIKYVSLGLIHQF